MTFTLLIILTSFAIGQSAANKIALLVGVSDYESERVTDLNYAENDIHVVGNQLKLMGFDVTSLAGKQATRKATIATIDRFMKQASELETNDIVLVMFSGHGQQIRVREETATGAKINEVPYFCPVDALPFDESKITTRGKSESAIGEQLNYVSLNRVLRGMDEQSNSLNNLLVVDACRNNPSKGKASGISGTSATVPQGVNILFAASSGQKSWESADEKIKHGVFSHFLIKGLRGKAKNSRGQVTWSRLASYLQEEVAFAGPALAGDEDRKQTPHSIINSSNLILLGSGPNTTSLSAGNWTRFRGENGQGKIAFSNIPLEWSETKNIRWKYKLPGPGASSPIIFDGQVFVTAYSGVKKIEEDNGRGGSRKIDDLSELKKHLLAIDIETGKQNWMTTVDGATDEEPLHVAHGYSSHSPVTDGEKIYAYFGRSGVYAYDLSGSQIWSRQFVNKKAKHAFGGGGSSIIFKDILVVNSGEETQKIHALDVSDGSIKWGFEDEGFADSNSTPVVVGTSDRTELVMILKQKCVGIDARTGKLNWKQEGEEHHTYQTSSPLLVGENIVFSRTRSSNLFALKKEEPGKMAWRAKVRPESTPIDTGDAILCFERRGVLTVVDRLTGEILDRQRLKSFSDKQRTDSISKDSPLSSPIMVDDCVVVVFGKGDAFVIAKEGDFYKTKFVNRLGDEEEKFLATPAVTQNELLIRSDKYLYCISKD